MNWTGTGRRGLAGYHFGKARAWRALDEYRAVLNRISSFSRLRLIRTPWLFRIGSD